MLDLIIRNGQVVTPWGVGDWDVADLIPDWEDALPEEMRSAPQPAPAQGD